MFSLRQKQKRGLELFQHPRLLTLWGRRLDCLGAVQDVFQYFCSECCSSHWLRFVVDDLSQIHEGK